MEPPEICKMVGRPKVKRERLRNENLKRQGEWFSSRKENSMTCSTCHQTGHNARGCAKKSKGKQAVAQSRLVDDPIVKRFKGSSSNNTTVLEPEDNFPSSFSSDEPDSSLRPMSFSEANTMILEKI
ncbi:hypothetical protein RND71_029342 [Anisodus tanguticus]|uniref:Uncharacterized protein n=1 Tax=Anisodus tanguticus TaxID=243964 RepID=A0AAE1REY3_9SOLA|nr:hypothetical protein RND71_029342 [Anisodus tanguticus]